MFVANESPTPIMFFAFSSLDDALIFQYSQPDLCPTPLPGVQGLTQQEFAL